VRRPSRPDPNIHRFLKAHEAPSSAPPSEQNA
jgi:hypothetical protein